MNKAGRTEAEASRRILDGVAQASLGMPGAENEAEEEAEGRDSMGELPADGSGKQVEVGYG